MAFKAELHVGGILLPVLEFHWPVVQSIDERGRPEKFIRGGQLHLVVDHLHHPVLDHWMSDAQQKLDGSLMVLGIDGTRFRTVDFFDAYCVGQGLYFNSTGIGRATSLSILISANRLLIDNTVTVSNA